MGSSMNILTLLETTDNELLVLKNKHLKNITAKTLNEGNTEFLEAVKALTPDDLLSSFKLPALIVPLPHLNTQELAALAYIAYDLSGKSSSQAKLISLNSSDAPAALWLNKEPGIKAGVVFFTTNYFDAETVAALGGSVVFHPLLPMLSLLKDDILKCEPSIKDCCLLATRIDGQVNTAMTTAGINYIYPGAENNFNKLFVKHGSDVLMAALNSNRHFPQEKELLEAVNIKGDIVLELAPGAHNAVKYYRDKEQNSIIAKCLIVNKNNGAEFEEILNLSSYVTVAGVSVTPRGDKEYVLHEKNNTLFVIRQDELTNIAAFKRILLTNGVKITSITGKEVGLLQTLIQHECLSTANRINVTHHNGWEQFMFFARNDNNVETEQTLNYYNISVKRCPDMFKDTSLNIVHDYKHTRNIFSAKGDLPTFQSKALPLLKGNVALMLPIFRALSAPLMLPLGICPVMFHYFCPTRRGKSTALALACAWVGIFKRENPFKAYESWDGSVAGISAMLADFNYGYLALDDLSVANPDLVEKIIYNLDRGELGARATQIGRQREITRFSCVVDSTGEFKVKDAMKQAGVTLKPGAYSRCIDIAFPSDDNFGIVKELNGCSSSCELIEKLEDIFTNEFRGGFWESWLEIIEGYFNNAKKLQKLKNEFSHFKIQCAESEVIKQVLSSKTHYSQILNNIYAVGFTMQLAIQHGILTEETIGFTPLSLVEHIFSWYLGDEEFGAVQGIVNVVREKCQEMVLYKTKYFTILQRPHENFPVSETPAITKHCGYVLITGGCIGLETQNSIALPKISDGTTDVIEEYYMTSAELRAFFGCSSKATINEIMKILREYKAIKMDANGSLLRSRLPSNRGAGKGYYTICPHRMLDIEDDKNSGSVL